MSGAAFSTLLSTRRSVRAFRPDPVPRHVIEDICRDARRAPSGANLQPGSFQILTGAPLGALAQTLQRAEAEGRPHDSEYSYFPQPMPPELKARQRAAGYALYQALGIPRRDIAGRRAQFDRNYAFFDAPVGVVVTIQRAMGKGCYMDMGMALMSFLLAAQARSLGATGIGALANHGRLVHQHLNLPETELVVCGIALGHPDTDHPVNQFRTERAGLDEFTTFHGFDD